MKHIRLAAPFALAALVLVGCDSKDAEIATTPAGSGVELTTLLQKDSYEMGRIIGDDLTNMRPASTLDSKALALGVQDALDNVEPRITMTEQEREDALKQARAKYEEENQKVMAAQAKEAQPNIDAGKKFLEENGKREGVVTTASGLQYEVLKKATDGRQPTENDIVTVHYEGKLLDGSVFDSSIARGQPVELFTQQVIPGWAEALQLMHVGEKYKLYIPYDLAYGVSGRPPMIPGGSTLVFDVELLNVKELPAAPGHPEAPAAQ